MRLLVPLLALLSVAPARAAGPGDDLFTTRVRPILAKHCFKCHGPDDKSRKARLRLDKFDEATRPARSRKRPIVPGKPAESELLARINADDESIMPPPSAKLALTGEQKQLLERWIREGAEYTPHWSFLSPKRPAVPAVKQSSWPRNPIDRFVLARLEKEGLSPAPEADRATLVRRVYLDLVGLPPTPEEVDDFLADTAANAWERLVDRLLASPRYGERWARRWLDLARYADTNGYEKDRVRSIWPYRDWVIDALNRDLSFDRFTIEQIAGDLLGGATAAQRIATGFHRNTMLNEEGGIDPLEFRFHAMTDRMATTGSVWLGLTIGCAQCHTHKYDPVSQKEYYRLFAFLNNCDEPEMPVPDPAIAARRQQIQRQIDALEAKLLAEAGESNNERLFQSWRSKLAKEVADWRTLKPVRATSKAPHLRVLGDSSILASGDQSKSDTYEVTFHPGLAGVTALRLEALPDERLPNGGPGRVYYEGPPGDFHLSEITLLADGKPVAFKEATQSFASGGSTAARAIDGDQQSGWSINGGQGRAHQAIFILKTPLASPRELKVRLLFERYYSAGLGRFRLSTTAAAKPPRAIDFPTDLQPLLLLEPDKWAPAQRRSLLKEFLRTAPELAKLRAPLEALRRQRPAFPTTLVMSERPAENPRSTFLHHRGEFLQPKERLEPDVPAALHPFPKDAPRNRLEFSKWLVCPDNPLVGRVTVNRQWAAFFGRGIVTTLGDFGLQGDAPSHPELLDWLATEFVGQAGQPDGRDNSPRKGDATKSQAGKPGLRCCWSMKRLHRLIVTSATYRQSSRVSPDLLARDPANRLLARGPRVRLEAEMVRDSVLRASGLLADRLGGPSVFPPQPAGVTTEGTYGGLAWRVSPGLDRYRRGLYTFSKRTAPYAFSGTFDAPSGEVCVARREVSNTPLQALTLLNDQAILEAAQELGRLMTNRNGSTEARVKYLFKRILTRSPTSQEVALLSRFFRSQWERFIKGDLDANAVAGSGDGEVTERAAWTALARVLFNLDEAIVKG